MTNNIEEEKTDRKMSRRHFLWLAWGTIGAFATLPPNLGIAPAFEEFGASALIADKSKPVFPKFDVGLNNAHALTKYLGVTNRLPLSRKYFEEGSKMKDPFYGFAEALQNYRNKGSNTIMIMEIHPEDSDSKLAHMFDTAQSFVHFRNGDSVILGNEINIKGLQYPPDTYARQATFLQKYIRGMIPKIQIGLAGEAMHGDNSVLKNILPKIDFPFVQPFHHYWVPQQILQRAASLRATLDYFGFTDMPITVGETGVADNTFKGNPKGFLAGSPRDQAHAIFKAFCFAKYAGCQSATWYSALDTPNLGYTERYGLMINSKEKREAFDAFIQASEIFNQAGKISMEYINNSYVFVLKGKDLITEISWLCPDQNTLGGPVTITRKFTRPRWIEGLLGHLYFPGG